MRLQNNFLNGFSCLNLILFAVACGDKSESISVQRVAMPIQQVGELRELSSVEPTIIQDQSVVMSVSVPIPDRETPIKEQPLANLYSRVIQEELTEKFGAETAKKMGQSWLRLMDWYSIVIGEPLLAEDGEELQVSFEEAKEACLNLNPESQRAAVRASLELGCYLMGKEDWQTVEEDFSAWMKHKGSFILPKLTGRWFWSSNSSDSNQHEAYHFSASETLVQARTGNSLAGVRCACVVE